MSLFAVEIYLKDGATMVVNSRISLYRDTFVKCSALPEVRLIL